MEAPPIGICQVCKRQVSLYLDPREDLYHTFMHRAPDGELCDGSHQLPVAYVQIVGEGECVNLRGTRCPKLPIITTLT